MWVDNYQLLPNGRIKLLEKIDDEFDVLYASKPGGLGNVDMGNYLQVNDQTILKSLSGIKPSNPIYRTTGSNKYALTSNLEDAFSVFKFVADNSTVEWGLRGLRRDGKNLYMLCTSLLTGSISNFDFNFKTSEITFDMHSHPGTGEKSKRASGYNNDGYLGDMKSVTKRYEDLRKIGREYPGEFPPHYIYHVLSQNLYQYTPWDPSIFVNKIGSAKILKEAVKILSNTR